MSGKQFNLAQEVRKLLEEHPGHTGPESLAELKKRFPRQKINEGSHGVAFYTARKDMGLSKPRKEATPDVGQPLNYDRLQRAAEFVAEMGGPDEALAAVQQVTAILRAAEGA